jgi:tetratricopeptide (TPR) repeat protein
MTRPRKPTRSALPPAPLEFASPLSVEGGDVSGAILIHELAEEYAPVLWRTYRIVVSLAKSGGGSILDPAELARWEQHVLQHVDVWEEGVWSAVTAVAAELRKPAEADRARIAFTCVFLADWCLAQGAARPAICWAEAAALVCPSSARYAYVAGRMHRERGNFREAEHWLERARRVAVWNDDREAHAIALNSLGNLNQQIGRYTEAESLLNAALRTAKRERLVERLPFIYHDLLVVAVYTGNLARAGEYAREALHAYPPRHPNVPKLAHDIAWLWFHHGQFRRALGVFHALLSFFTEPDLRLHVLGYAARAAGALGREAEFDRYWVEAWRIMESVREALRAAAALELGLGAIDLSRWSDAGRALALAVESAAASGENETLVRAAAVQERLDRREPGDWRVGPHTGRDPRPEDALAGELVAALVEQGSVRSDGVSGVEHGPNDA